jgi:polyisoprenoid-binding protein YceI
MLHVTRALAGLVAAIALCLAPAAASAAPWRIEPETSLSVDVAWRDATVTVRFPALSGTVDFDIRRPDRARAVILADAASATTGLAPADQLLRGDGYLDARRYPTIEFQLDRLVQTSKSTADVFGRLTLRGITRPVAFRAQVFRYGPPTDDPDRFEAGFDIAGTVDRTAFGSTAGLPDVSAVLPVRLRLLMSSVPP